MFFSIFFTNKPKLGLPKISLPHEVRSTPVRTTSFMPLSISEFIELITFCVETDLLGPLPNGITQNVHLWSQPF